MFAFVFMLLAVFFSAINASTHSYTSSLSINGAMGYMRVQFDALQNAVYTVDLDMTDFKTTCDMTQGLTYHIHSFWTDTETNSVTTCSNTGMYCVVFYLPLPLPVFILFSCLISYRMVYLCLEIIMHIIHYFNRIIIYNLNTFL